MGNMIPHLQHNPFYGATWVMDLPYHLVFQTGCNLISGIMTRFPLRLGRADEAVTRGPRGRLAVPRRVPGQRQRHRGRWRVGCKV